MVNLFFVKEEKALNIYIPEDADGIIKSAAEDYAETLFKVSGVKPEILTFDESNNIKSGIVLVLTDQVNKTDGFSVDRYSDVIKISSSTSSGVYYGLHDFLEKNMQVVWARGAREYFFEYIPQSEIEITKYGYKEQSPFIVRGLNMCGHGDGGDHKDRGSARYYAVNKMNGLMDKFDDDWSRFGLKGMALHVDGSNINDLADKHPEYFMKEKDGNVRISNRRRQSYINYYNVEVADVIADRIIAWIDEKGENSIPQYIMPDDPWFYMFENGEELSAKPFTADDGTTVYPEDENYKSTVYFNFINRVARILKKRKPNAKLFTFAYVYSTLAPAIEIEDNVCVMLTTILTNDKHSYTDTRYHDNDKDKQNIERWVKKCKTLCLYNYWNCFDGKIYSRPTSRVVQENLKWYREIGVYGIMAESHLDVSKEDAVSIDQKDTRLIFDMNEAYTWVMLKLIWNPDQDVNELLERFCNVVYKECAKEMLNYFHLIESGWNSKDALIWYTTGGDVYILQFIIKAGIADAVLEVLSDAVRKAENESVKERVESVYRVMKEQIAKYSGFVDEAAKVLKIKPQDVTGEKVMDYLNNPKSIWNRAIPIKVMKNYKTLEDYPKEAEFDCRMLCDENNIYIGFTVKDDKIISEKNGEYFREDGSKVTSYAETYIGGNDLNKTEYYGFISGIYERGTQVYLNAGSPIGIPTPQGFEDVKFVKFSDNPKERYLFHVQVIPLTALQIQFENFRPYGSFVYYTNRFGRAGWKGTGLWSKINFSQFEIIEEEI